MSGWTCPPLLMGILFVAVFLGAAIQNLFGIGFGLVVSPLVLFIDHRLLPTLIIVLGTLSSVPIAVSSLDKLNWSHCATALASRLVGSVAGAMLLSRVIGGTGSQAFEILFAATLIVAIIFSTVKKMGQVFLP